MTEINVKLKKISGKMIGAAVPKGLPAAAESALRGVSYCVPDTADRRCLRLLGADGLEAWLDSVPPKARRYIACLLTQFRIDGRSRQILFCRDFSEALASRGEAVLSLGDDGSLRLFPKKDAVDAYLELAKTRPELFAAQDAGLRIVLDEAEIRDFALKSGKPMGVAVDNMPYNMALYDLCEKDGRRFSYFRVIHGRSVDGTVAMCRRKSDGRIALLRIFRAALREESSEFPRGFLEPELSESDNMKKEIREELGAETLEIKKLGVIQSDTGMVAAKSAAFLAVIDDARIRPGYEEINALEWVTEDELRARIRDGRIWDAYTISVFGLFLCAR
jgi:hypothetical protein